MAVVSSDLRALARVRSTAVCPQGIRTPVAAAKGRCPRPLDHGDAVSFQLPKGLSGARRDRAALAQNTAQAVRRASLPVGRRVTYLTAGILAHGLGMHRNH